MDVADLVQPSAVSLLRAPALHMVVIGVLLFGGELLWRGSPSREWPRVVIPPQRLEIMRQAFLAENRRPPTAAEAAALLDYLVDQEVLYQYALKFGLHEQPVAQRRLAQIASFVGANPHEPRSDEERAAEAVSLGLHHGDLVVRRILIDGARRLIRAGVLMRQPDPAMVEEDLAANRELFMQPARTRITHVAVDGFKWPRDAKERATALLERLQQESIAPEAAPALGDEPFVPSALPLLNPKDLQTRFGATFEQALKMAPEGAWFGPVASRFGYHLVWVHERQEASLPPFDEIRERVEHIFTGWDHLLFVLGLVLLVGRGRTLLWTITAFTVGHSITLALASLGLVRVPQGPMEAAIAFSVYLLAVELVRSRAGCPSGGPVGRRPCRPTGLARW